MKQRRLKRHDDLIALALERGSSATILAMLTAATTTTQTVTSPTAATVRLDTPDFALPAGATRIFFSAFIYVEAAHDGDSVVVNAFMDGTNPTTPFLQGFFVTALMGQIGVGAAISGIITPGDNDPHTYSIVATNEATNDITIHGNNAAITLIPLP